VIKRQGLLLEYLIKRRKTRQSDVYFYRKPMGPPPGDEKINRLIHAAAQEFDFGPLITGDQQQVRQIASDFIEHLTKHARSQGVDKKIVHARLKQMSPFIRRGLMFFHATLDGRLKTK
jgi:hypothetical protein